MRLQHGIGLATPVIYNIAYFPKPGGKDPLNFQLFLSYAFVTRPLLNIHLAPTWSPHFLSSRIATE